VANRFKIVGWDKINARKDVTNPSWFKFKHAFFEDPEFYDFTQAELLAWIYMLCLASKKSSDEIEINFAHAERIGRLKRKDIDSAIKKLLHNQLVPVDVTCAVRGRDADVTCAGARLDKIRLEEIREDKKESSSEHSGECIETALCYFSLDAIFQERKVSRKVQESWIAAFPESEWVCNEIQKALAWEVSNPSRRKKNFASFITRWMTKGWDQRRTSSGSDPFAFLNGAAS
jgi:hypothetical protein